MQSRNLFTTLSKLKHQPLTRRYTTNVYKKYLPTVSKSTMLRQLLYSGKTYYGIESHSGMSAKIAEEEKFPFIWGSGLCISAAQGFPDVNQMTSSEVIVQAKYMASAVKIPVFLDMDTGYGNFNNAAATVRDMELAGIAGGAMEDKLFPKTNSFIGDSQELANIDEFCGKIRACQDAKTNPDFVIAARCESLIAGRGVADALHRAEQYRLAGADAILIHSKKANYDEIKEWIYKWEHRLPVIIVPTKYAESTPVGTFEKDNVNFVIWANHMLRASMTAMRNLSSTLKSTRDLNATKPLKIASVDEIFRLTGESNVKEMEKKYIEQIYPYK